MSKYCQVYEARVAGALTDATSPVTWRAFGGTASDYATGAVASGTATHIGTGLYLIAIDADPAAAGSPWAEGGMYVVAVDYTTASGSERHIIPQPLVASNALASLVAQLAGLSPGRIAALDAVVGVSLLREVVGEATRVSDELYVYGPVTEADEAERNVGGKISHRQFAVDGQWWYEWWYYAGVDDTTPVEKRTFSVAPPS